MLTSMLRNSVIRDIGYLSGARIFSAICGLAVTVVWAQLMPAELFGEFKVVIAAATFISAFCLAGTAQAAIMAAAKNQDGSLILLIRHKLIANVGGSGTLACAAAYYGFSPDGSLSIAFSLLAAALAFPLYNLTDIWMSWANGKSRLKEVAFGQCAVALLALAAILIAALFRSEYLWLVILYYMGALAGANVTMTVRAAAQRSNADIDHSIIGFGQHATVAMMFGSLLSLDVVILNHFYSPQEVAIYVIALQFPDQLKALFAVLGQVVAPRLYSAKNIREAWQSLNRSFWMLYGAMIFLGIVGFIALPPVTELLFGARYAESASYGKWLWLTLALAGPTTYLGTALLATKRPIFVYLPNIGYPLLLTGLYLLLVGDGVAGMTLARIIATVTLACLFTAGFFYCLYEQRRLDAPDRGGENGSTAGGKFSEPISAPQDQV